MLITWFYECPQGSKPRPKEKTAAKAGVTKDKFQRIFMTGLTSHGQRGNVSCNKGSEERKLNYIIVFMFVEVLNWKEYQVF